MKVVGQHGSVVLAFENYAVFALSRVSLVRRVLHDCLAVFALAWNRHDAEAALCGPKGSSPSLDQIAHVSLIMCMYLRAFEGTCVVSGRGGFGHAHGRTSCEPLAHLHDFARPAFGGL